jgi:threonine/homoserine/homoserine lactone efflux protein
MLDLQTILTFSLASVLLALAPGPDNIFVLTQSALHGKRAGLATTAGLMNGVLVHTCAVAFGIAAVFQASATAFSLLKYAGAAYLLFLAWKSFRAQGQAIDTGHGGKLKLRQLYARGVIMNVTNPKVSLFFLAFLPQFADPARGSMTLQFLALGGLFILSALPVFIGVALLAGQIGACLNRSARAQSALNKIAGTVFAGLALKIATAHR